MRARSLVLLGAAATVGLAAGLGGFTFLYARGASYLTDDPAACANCHVMKDQFDGWVKSTHHRVAVCNSCHTPPGLVRKYFVKALNGWHHSRAFTLGDYHEPIAIKAGNLAVTEEACRHCHQDLVQAIETHPGGGALSCVTCHRDVGHLH